MRARRLARESALQLLYQWEGSQTEGETADLSKTIETFWKGKEAETSTREFAGQLFRGALARQKEIDGLIEKHAQHWKIDRIAAIDRNILRLGIFELLAYPETPRAVVIDEALEVAKRFSAAESSEFINGILDAVRKSLESTAPEQA